MQVDSKDMDHQLPHEVLLDKVFTAIKRQFPTIESKDIHRICQHFLGRLVDVAPDWKDVIDTKDFDYQFDAPEQILQPIRKNRAIGFFRDPLDPKCKAFVALDNKGSYINHIYISDAACRYSEDFGIRARVNLLMKKGALNVESGAVFKDDDGNCFFWLKKNLIEFNKKEKLK